MTSVNKPTLNLAVAFNAFRNLRQTTSALGISPAHKIAAVSVTVSVILLGVLAQYLRKKKRTTNESRKSIKRPMLNSAAIRECQANDEASSRPRSPSIRSIRRQGSVLSGVSSASEFGRPDFRKNLSLEPTDSFTPQQLGVMGMEALEMSITYWEDAMSAYARNNATDSLAITNEEESEFCKELQRLLDSAYKLQDECELLFLDQRSVLFRPGGSTRFDSECEGGRSEFSPAESFVSAQDDGWQMADLREFDEFADLNVNVEELSLYQSALKHLEENGIPCRCLRTELLRCSSDVEYLCKLHCIRIAFQWLMRDESKRTWIANTGRQILTDLLLYANKDPKEFLIAYEEMLTFLSDEKCWEEIEKELTARGVKAMTFYDIVLDYILLDAFEDLDTPPSSVLAVVQNRWLSNGFKESALATAVWSVLRAKKRMLKFPNGFMAHFYSISEKISPLMAWGFLGPDEDLKETCVYFKEQVMSFLNDIFSFRCCRYTSVEDLAEDIMKQITARIDNTITKLTEKSALNLI
ncbi:mitoguardin [Planococcus citri]|uniref:mitoguardin n=1 Tax=Planococcus citri TaxID=170843 RepID=UPI0031F90919